MIISPLKKSYTVVVPTRQWNRFQSFCHPLKNTVRTRFMCNVDDSTILLCALFRMRACVPTCARKKHHGERDKSEKGKIWGHEMKKE